VTGGREERGTFAFRAELDPSEEREWSMYRLERVQGKRGGELRYLLKHLRTGKERMRG
jgi:hypothetical protein